MWLHTSVEPEIKGGIRGAARDVAEAAEELAETGQTMIYVLIALSLFRLMPYRWWRFTHKLFGIPFAFASVHFFTTEKTYANGSPWGWWFGAWMLVGMGAWLLRVVGIDMIGRGRHYKVVAAEHAGTHTRLELAPAGRPLGHELGQFAFVKLDVAGLREPHPFTIASSPEAPNLEFFVGHLGDWSSRLSQADLVGKSVRVEGPYGQMKPFGHDNSPIAWIAGGIGCTPFLAAVSTATADPALEPAPAGAVSNATSRTDRAQPSGQSFGGRPIPTMLYGVRSTEDNPMLDRLRQAEAAGHIRLELFTPATGRMRPDDLDRLFPDGMQDHHVVLCGPAALVNDMSAAARDRGATSVDTEDFDIRQGFGPDRSLEIDRAVRRRVRSR